jgi:hypothetical protein
MSSDEVKEDDNDIVCEICKTKNDFSDLNGKKFY